MRFISRVARPAGRLAALLLASGAIVALFAAPAGAAASPGASAVSMSSVTKTVSVDPATGAVASLTTGSSVSPDVSMRNVCDTGDFCYQASAVPYANYGFYGSAGTRTGSWPNRASYNTGKFTGHGCWNYGGKNVCTQNFGPNTEVEIGAVVTGTSVTIN
ncbi:MAG TPA: hypothetical protein VG756_20815 [Pseudonocardiaceae bacterium]|jgi:hypothetical protein|nr:hypothetical protein [Pseudonocardiaceae bacterium]